MYDTINFWLLQALGMWVVALLIPGLKISSFSGAFSIVACLALINATIWDAALFLRIPDHFSLHALSVFVANGALFWILVKILPGIEIKGALPAVIAPVAYSFINLILAAYGEDLDLIQLLKQVAEHVSTVRDELITSSSRG